MRMFYTLLALYAASHMYIFICLRRVFGPGRYLWPVGILLLLMAVSWLLRVGRVPVGMLDSFQTVSFAWMGYALILLLCLLALDVSGLGLRLGAKLFGVQTGLFSSARMLGLGFLISFPLFAWGLYEARTPRVIRMTINTPLLPADARPLEIVQMSDLHISALIGPGTLERMRDTVAAEKPDILLLVGDLVDGNMEEREADAAVMRSFPARLGKFAVTGNHEAYHGPEQSLRFIEACGFQILRQKSVEAGGIVLAGVDDDTFARAAGTKTDEAVELLRGLGASRYVLFLQHKPYPPDAPFDLMVSGHTHGGQIWPGTYVTRRIYGFGQGFTQLPDFAGKARMISISNGLGFWGPPVRLFTPPDIVHITLQPQAR